jgi:hypothetical protein
MAGGKGGVSTAGDVLVNQTSDGVNLQDVWSEIQEVLDLWNKERMAGAIRADRALSRRPAAR